MPPSPTLAFLFTGSMLFEARSTENSRVVSQPHDEFEVRQAHHVGPTLAQSLEVTRVRSGRRVLDYCIDNSAA